MSKLGNIYNSYGSQFSIAVANTNGVNILNGSNLPANSIIIASPVDKDNNDIGSYSLFATDSESNPIRLTYTIQEGNGLIYDNDSIKIKIDDKSIKDNNELYIPINNLIDNKTLNYNEEKDKIDINIDGFTKSDENNLGVFTIDGETLSISEDILTVNTNKLQYANKSTNQYGIGIGDGKTVLSTNGVFSINTDNLDLSKNGTFGIIRSTNDIIEIEDGIVSVNTENISYTSKDNFGISKIDDKTIKLNEEEQITVNTENLRKADGNNFGVFMYDSNSFEMNDNNELSIRDYSKINSDINNIDKKLSTIKNDISKINESLKSNNFTVLKPTIYDFHCSSLLSRVLNKPKKKKEKIQEMRIQIIPVEFTINTNCPFTVSVLFEDNVDPQISLYEINYNDTDIFKGNLGLGMKYQSTNLEPLYIKFTFLCKNYQSTKNEYSKITRIKITISSSNDANIYKSIIYSIVRFNSLYDEEIEYKDNNAETYL